MAKVVVTQVARPVWVLEVYNEDDSEVVERREYDYIEDARVVAERDFADLDVEFVEPQEG